MQSLTVPGNLDSLGAIADFVKTAATDAGLDKKATYRLRLAVDEIATNIIVHGYEETGQAGDLNLHANIDDQDLTVVIEDTAIAFNPLHHVLPEASALKEPLAERPIGGLGVYLTLEGIDQFHYQRVNDRNQNTFIMHRSNVSSGVAL